MEVGFWVLWVRGPNNPKQVPGSPTGAPLTPIGPSWFLGRIRAPVSNKLIPRFEPAPALFLFLS